MKRSLPNLRNYLKQATAIGVALTIAICLSPEAAQARRYSGSGNSVIYTFDIDTFTSDVNSNPNEGKFPGALQNLSLFINNQPELFAASADLVSSPFDRLPADIGTSYAASVPFTQEFGVSAEEVSAAFISGFGSGVK